MRDYFKPGLMYRKTHWKFWTSLPSEIFDWMKYSIQRGLRGYSDYDCWSVDSYLCEIIPNMVKQLKRDTHGYPAALTEEKWNEILDKISFGFESGKRAANSDNWVLNEYSDVSIEDGQFKIRNSWTEEQIKHFRELDEKDMAAFNEGMKLFTEFFFGLWD